MMKLHAFLVFLLLTTSALLAQIGVGDKNYGTAEVAITGQPTGVPAMRLTPQTAPDGTATGQLSVIGDKLYHYDATRAKWLSVEYTLFNFGLAGPVNNQDLEYVGDIELSGPRMPFDGTIVYVTMNASSGAVNKPIQIHINGVPVPDSANPNIDGLLELDNYTYTNTSYNLDFNAGDYIQVDVPSGGAVWDPSVLLKVKWRK